MSRWLALLWLLACAPALSACHRDEPAPSGEPQPPASAIQVGVALGGCTDIKACLDECEAGAADRCRRLAVTYAMARGVERDEARATELYERACDMKDWASCVFAGQMHEYHHGVPEDLAAATAFYARACDAHWGAACYNLAIMVENGRGVPADPVRAASLYDIACAAGAKIACTRAQDLRGLRD
jgi:uncharacterized protein